jgi:hypothetical protein
MKVVTLQPALLFDTVKYMKKYQHIFQNTQMPWLNRCTSFRAIGRNPYIDLYVTYDSNLIIIWHIQACWHAPCVLRYVS